jgi:hypothetical protein
VIIRALVLALAVKVLSFPLDVVAYMDMEKKLIRYLNAERRTARFLFGVSALGLALAMAGQVYFATPFAISMARTSAVMIGLAVLKGIIMHQRATRLSARLPSLLARRPAEYKEEEGRRVAELEVESRRHLGFAQVSLIVGILLALGGGVFGRYSIAMGAGYGLCITGAILFVVELASGWRLSFYAHDVDAFRPGEESED